MTEALYTPLHFLISLPINVFQINFLRLLFSSFYSFRFDVTDAILIRFSSLRCSFNLPLVAVLTCVGVQIKPQNGRRNGTQVKWVSTEDHYFLAKSGLNAALFETTYTPINLS